MVLCFLLEILPVLVQRTVAFVMVIHAHRLSDSVLRFCLVRARETITDKMIKQTLLRLDPPEDYITHLCHDNDLGRRLSESLYLSEN